MFPLLILGVALLAGVLLAGQWFASADPKALVKALKWLLFGIIAAVVLFFVFTGRLAWAAASIPALLPWLVRARRAHQMYTFFSRLWGGGQGRPPGGSQGGPDGGAYGGQDRGGSRDGLMTREEAWKILGLEPGASKHEIKAAHHRLISGLHPDLGGSTYLAAQINRAKDILLKN